MKVPIHFSRSERSGFIIFILLLFFAVAIWQFVRHSHRAVISNEDQSLHQEWESFSQNHVHSNQEGDSSVTSSYELLRTNEELLAIPYAPHPFDPNTAAIELMVASGVPLHSARRIVKYRNKGGAFYDKEKLRHFGFSEEEYLKVAPYITIPERRHHSSYKAYDNKYPKYERIPEPDNLDINKASQEELMRFKGIGPGYSKRITEYRDKLGGFISMEQLKEVYGLPDSIYLHIRDRIVINAESIRKIHINSATEEELAAHPYIRKYMAANIVRLRNDLKRFRTIVELRQVPLINEEKYRKIVPYIQID